MLGLQVHVYMYTPTQHTYVHPQSHITHTHTYLLVLCIPSLLHLGQVREDGGTARVAAYHSIPCVHMAGPNELVELHCKDVGVCTTSTSAPLCFTTVCGVGWEGKGGEGGSELTGVIISIYWYTGSFFLKSLATQTLSTQFITNKQSRGFPVTHAASWPQVVWSLALCLVTWSLPIVRLLIYFLSFCCANALPRMCTTTCQCLCGQL